MTEEKRDYRDFCKHDRARPEQYVVTVCPCCGYRYSADSHCGICGREPVEIRLVPAPALAAERERLPTHEEVGRYCEYYDVRLS